MTEPLLIRDAHLADVAPIVALLADDPLGQAREDTSDELNDRYQSAFRAIERDENQQLVVAEIAGVISGCLQLTFIPGLSRTGMWRGQIESVRIAREVQGQQVGRQLLRWAITRCESRGCGLVQLTTDKTRNSAISFYQSLGFEASHEGMKLSLPLPRQS
jgi:ribosomal protein S18 acetylase RimI-like enzyme